jgi:adenylyltransferase/sulfurtransferase
MTAAGERYIQQIEFEPIGEEGQRRLSQSRALICGCGALGSTIANLLVRAGIGFLRIADYDTVDMSNLHRQLLFDEQDVRQLKSVVVAQKLLAANRFTCIEAINSRIDSSNIERLCSDVDVILDGTDNFATKFIINDAAIRLKKPWIFGGCNGAYGNTITIVPGRTACLRCLFPGGAPADDEEIGMLGPITNIIASIEAAEALKICSGNLDHISTCVTAIDLWQNVFKQIKISCTKCQACSRLDGF